MGKQDDDKKDSKNGGIVEKFLSGIGIDNSVDYNDEYSNDDYEEYEGDEDYEDEPEPVAKEKAPKRSLPKFVPAKRGNGGSSRGGRGDEMYTIHRMHAKTIEDGKQITEYLKNKTTVIINLEGVDLAVAQRIIDYTSGSCFALDAKLESISSYIFMASPNTANVTADSEDDSASSIDVPNSDFSDYL